MNRLHVELKLRTLRAQVGDRLRRGAPVMATLRKAIAELEAHTRVPDLPFMRQRLRVALKDWHFSLLLRANPWLMLQRGFFRRPAAVVAPALLSKVIVTADGRAGRIAEVSVDERGTDDSTSNSPHSTDLAGRLVLTGETPERCAGLMCVCDSQPSKVVITAIEPLEGSAVMEAQAGIPPDKEGLYRGSAVVFALGLSRRHQGGDVTEHKGAIRIAWDLQVPPLVLGQARSVRRNRVARVWRWGLPRR
jgi:DNA-3-methyladenine glycosylase